MCWWISGFDIVFLLKEQKTKDKINCYSHHIIYWSKNKNFHSNKIDFLLIWLLPQFLSPRPKRLWITYFWYLFFNYIEIWSLAQLIRFFGFINNQSSHECQFYSTWIFMKNSVLRFVRKFLVCDHANMK